MSYYFSCLILFLYTRVFVINYKGLLLLCVLELPIWKLIVINRYFGIISRRITSKVDITPFFCRHQLQINIWILTILNRNGYKDWSRMVVVFNLGIIILFTFPEMNFIVIDTLSFHWILPNGIILIYPCLFCSRFFVFCCVVVKTYFKFNRCDRFVVFGYIFCVIQFYWRSLMQKGTYICFTTRVKPRQVPNGVQIGF